MKSRRFVLAAAAGVAAFTAVAASAASLGGLSSASLGADQVVVAACDTDGVTVDYTTSYDAALSGYAVSSVDLSGVDAGCTGQDLKLNLSGPAGSLADLSGTVSGTTMSVPVPAGVAAVDVTKTALTISG